MKAIILNSADETKAINLVSSVENTRSSQLLDV